MSLSLLKDIYHKPTIKKEKTAKVIKDVKKETIIPKESTVKQSPCKGAFYGAMFGVGAGIGDGILTSYSNSKNIKVALEEFRGYSYADKRLAVQQLHSIGKTVKDYKNNLRRMQSLPVMAVNRALIYGGVLAATGLAIDLYRNHKGQKKQINSKNNS